MYVYDLGDDWEHEEIFTDDDEAVGNDPEEREDLAPEVPAPPEIKQVCWYACNHNMLVFVVIGALTLIISRHFEKFKTTGGSQFFRITII